MTWLHLAALNIDTRLSVEREQDDDHGDDDDDDAIKLSRSLIIFFLSFDVTSSENSHLLV